MKKYINETHIYSPYQISELLNVPIEKIYMWVRSNNLPSFRLRSNGQLRIHGKDLKIFLDKNPTCDNIVNINERKEIRR